MNQASPICAYCRTQVQANQQPVQCPQCQAYSHGVCWQRAGNCPMCMLRAHQAQQQQAQQAQQPQQPQPQAQQTQAAQTYQQDQGQTGGIAGLELQAPAQVQAYAPAQQAPAQQAPAPSPKPAYEVLEDEEDIPVLTSAALKNPQQNAPAEGALNLELKEVSEDDIEIDLELQFEAVRHSPRMAELRKQDEQSLLRGLALKGRRDRFEIFTKRMILSSIGTFLASFALSFISFWLIIPATLIIVLTTAIVVMKRKQKLISKENEVDVEPIPVRVEQISRSRHRMAILGLDILTDEAPLEFVPIQESNVERLIGINISYLTKKSFRTGDMAILIADDGYALILECFEFQQIARMAKTTEEFKRRYNKMLQG
ncbi:MAG: hypothetical protein P1V97_24075 [Planctomycetota bacterium]|nr:hypothetical protein [Planctomycetota bacterium]